MKLSENLSDLNYSRYQDWQEPVTLNEQAQPAVTVFTGEVYKGLDAASFTDQDFINAQKDLMILSGLYGILKPLDLMYPYRLEMGTRWNVTPKTKNLYQYWGRSEEHTSELQSRPHLVCRLLLEKKKKITN